MIQGIIEKYGTLIDLPSYSHPISLGEGSTPLIKIESIDSDSDLDFELFIKYEGLNPTGSFKDRGMVTAMSVAVGSGAKTVICASTGNTAASAAAYAARAGINAEVIIPKGKIARGKRVALDMYGAKVIEIDGNFDDALNLVRARSEEKGVAIVNSINPYRLEGQKTAAFEVCDDLGTAPDFLFVPVGNAGNITAYAFGFKQYNDIQNTGLPVLMGVQAEGASPLVTANYFDNPETVATAIRIGKPARGEQATKLVKESGGGFISVSDTEILSAQKKLARNGIWVEPASAASFAGLIKKLKSKSKDYGGKKVVVVCTGHGLKDTDLPVS